MTSRFAWAAVGKKYQHLTLTEYLMLERNIGYGFWDPRDDRFFKISERHA